SAARGVHITLSRFRVKRLFTLFSADPAACNPLFRVSGAHYRELFQADKGKFKIIFRVRIFSSKPIKPPVFRAF
ncbi:hypothetical protein M5Y73_17150, partial [Citrobacter cronae]|nr:hypothetical protein [Citrobacter cronae]